MRQHRTLFESVRRRTGMYFQQEAYSVVAAFVLGYDAACEGGLLAGFREWLIIRLRTGSNLSWAALVLHAAFPEAASPQDEAALTRERNRHAIEKLFDLLEEFDSVRAKPDGLKHIFLEYEKFVAEAAKRGPRQQ